MNLLHQTSNRIKQPKECCVYCGKGYKTRTNLEKHLLLCEMLHKRSNPSPEEEDFVPSQKKIYQSNNKILKLMNKINQASNKIFKWKNKIIKLMSKINQTKNKLIKLKIKINKFKS